MLMATAMCAGSASAAFKAPEIYQGASFQQISANGQYALSNVYGTVVYYNLEDGTFTPFDEDETGTTSYTLGCGNGITADGTIFVGSYLAHFNAAYYENGEWRDLPVPDPDKTNTSHGITPDGSRICGNIGLNEMTFDEVIMQIPCYWERQADGTYGDPVILPYPTKDLFGQTPQYLTAVTISDDGKTIVGQMQFSSGSMAIPVLYQQDAQGEWSYSLPTKHLFNPNEIEAVENPGEFEEMAPSYEDYMTQEEQDEYYAAIDEYYQNQDWSAPYPEFVDYMTPEAKAAYLAATAEYQEKYDAWWAKYEAYLDYSNQVIEESPNFLFNNVLLSTDGRYIVSTLEETDPNAGPWDFFSQIYTPCKVEIATGELTRIDSDLSLTVSGVADGGVIYAYNGQRSVPMLGYVITEEKVESLYDFLKNINQEYATWIDKNMTHEVAVDFDPETYEDIIEELTFTGMPISTPDQSVIAIWNNCPWTYEYFAEGVIFHVDELSGVANVALGTKQMTLRNGALLVPEGYVALKVYNLGGQCVKSIAAPQGIVELDMNKGVYIVKGVRADGNETIIKLCK